MQHGANNAKTPAKNEAVKEIPKKKLFGMIYLKAQVPIFEQMAWVPLG